MNAHIKCEQYARFSTGNFFNFNGTGGVWRKSCIDDAGGWNARTLVEDMVRVLCLAGAPGCGRACFS